jgi:hypothetical protein
MVTPIRIMPSDKDAPAARRIVTVPSKNLDRATEKDSRRFLIFRISEEQPALRHLESAREFRFYLGRLRCNEGLKLFQGTTSSNPIDDVTLLCERRNSRIRTAPQHLEVLRRRRARSPRRRISRPPRRPMPWEPKIGQTILFHGSKTLTFVFCRITMRLEKSTRASSSGINIVLPCAIASISSGSL